MTTEDIPARPPRNIRLTLEYDGRAYVGWERQKNGRGIQAVLESVIERITQERTTINGSGRTDAGVHSRGQVANFTLRNLIPASDLQRALNALLPDDIAVRDLREVDLFFHARFSAIKKTYRYTILNDRIPRPLERHLYWPVFAALDRGAMQAAAERLVGRHDFSAFCREAESYDDCTRTLFTLRVIDRGPFLDIEAEADGFMWNMVRIIVGTLVHVGLGKLSADDIDSILESKDRKQAGPTAPSEGLMLFKVHYPDED